MTYEQLIAAISDWTHRADLATPAPTFLQLAEGKLSRLLKLSQFSTSVDLTFLAGSSSAELPTDYLEGRSLVGSDGDWTQKTPEQLSRLRAVGSSDKSYAIYGGSVHLPFEVGSDTTLTLHYWQRIPELTSSDPTNWLSENAADVYLWTALAFAATYAKNMQAAMEYEARAQGAIAELRSADQSATWFAASLSADYVV